VVPISASIEAQIADMPRRGQEAVSRGHGDGRAGLNRVNPRRVPTAWAAHLLHRPAEGVRAWTIPAGVTAPQRRRRSHTDFERASSARGRLLDDFVSAVAKQGAKESASCAWKGKDYTVRDGDVIRFRFNV